MKRVRLNRIHKLCWHLTSLFYHAIVHYLILVQFYHSEMNQYTLFCILKFHYKNIFITINIWDVVEFILIDAKLIYRLKYLFILSEIISFYFIIEFKKPLRKLIFIIWYMFLTSMKLIFSLIKENRVCFIYFTP